MTPVLTVHHKLPVTHLTQKWTEASLLLGGAGFHNTFSVGRIGCSRGVSKVGKLFVVLCFCLIDHFFIGSIKVVLNKWKEGTVWKGKRFTVGRRIPGKEVIKLL